MVTQTTEQPQGALTVTVVMEMFNLQQQPLLDAYQADQISLAELKNKYNGMLGCIFIDSKRVLEMSVRNVNYAVRGKLSWLEQHIKN